MNTQPPRSKLLIGLCVVMILGGLFFMSINNQNNKEVSLKIDQHHKHVKNKQDEISTLLDEKEEELKKKMAPMMNQKDDIRIKTDEVMEFHYVDAKRRTERAEKRIDDDIELTISKLLSGDKSVPNTSWIYEECDCYSLAEQELFSLRSWIIAKKNLAQQYQKDIEHILSFKKIDDWEEATLRKKRVYIKEAEEYNLDATDKELIDLVVNRKNPDGVLANCIRRAKKSIPILVKYDSSYSLLSHLEQTKKTADLFDISKDIDWTVPLMVKQEQKDFEKFLNDWGEKYFKENPDIESLLNSSLSVDYRAEDRSKYRRAKDRAVYNYIEDMNKKYTSLAPNLGLEYAIYTKYRRGVGISIFYYDYFENPNKTYHHNKRINIYLEDIDSGRLKIIAGNKLQIGNKIITLEGVRLPRKGKVYPWFENAWKANRDTDGEGLAESRIVFIDQREFLIKELKEFSKLAIKSKASVEEKSIYAPEKSYCDIWWDQHWNADGPPSNEFKGKCMFSGTDIGAWLVKSGFIYIDGKAYAKEENEAKVAIEDKIKNVQAFDRDKDKEGLSIDYKKSVYYQMARYDNQMNIWLEKYLDTKNKKWKKQF